MANFFTFALLTNGDIQNRLPREETFTRDSSPLTPLCVVRLGVAVAVRNEDEPTPGKYQGHPDLKFENGTNEPAIEMNKKRAALSSRPFLLNCPWTYAEISNRLRLEMQLDAHLNLPLGGQGVAGGGSAGQKGSDRYQTILEYEIELPEMLNI